MINLFKHPVVALEVTNTLAFWAASAGSQVDLRSFARIEEQPTHHLPDRMRWLPRGLAVPKAVEEVRATAR